jgi:Domain of unknown function (DUF4878)
MIKTFKFTAIALLAVVLLLACSSKGPKGVARKFLNAFVAGDYEGASKYATRDAQESLKMMASMDGGSKAEAAKIEIGDVKENGDQATVSYKENGTAQTLHLVKEDGEWKVNWIKGAGDLENAVKGALEDAIDGALEGTQDGEGAAPGEKNGGETDH